MKAVFKGMILGATSIVTLVGVASAVENPHFDRERGAYVAHPSVRPVQAGRNCKVGRDEIATFVLNRNTPTFRQQAAFTNDVRFVKIVARSSAAFINGVQLEFDDRSGRWGNRAPLEIDVRARMGSDGRRNDETDWVRLPHEGRGNGLRDIETVSLVARDFDIRDRDPAVILVVGCRRLDR